MRLREERLSVLVRLGSGVVRLCEETRAFASYPSSILYSRARPKSGLAETGQALVQALPHPKVATEAAGPRGVTQRSTPSPLVMIGNVRAAVRTASCRSRRERFGGPASGRICVV